MSVKQFFGWILIVIGVLIMLFSGGCSLFFLFAVGFGDNAPVAALFFGGIPFLIGWGLYAGGKGMMPKKSNGEDVPSSLGSGIYLEKEAPSSPHDETKE